MLISLTLAVPHVTAARLRSIQYVVHTESPVTTAWQQNPCLSLALFWKKFCIAQIAVPVIAAALAGAAPVPYLIWNLAHLALVPLSASHEIIISILPFTAGVIEPANPIITPTVELVPVGSAGVH